MGRLGWGWRPVQSQSYHSLGLCIVPPGQAYVVQEMGVMGGQRGTLAWCKDKEGHIALDSCPVPLHSAAWVSSDVDIPPTRLTRHWDRLAQVCVLRRVGYVLWAPQSHPGKHTNCKGFAAHISMVARLENVPGQGFRVLGGKQVDNYCLKNVSIGTLTVDRACSFWLLWESNMLHCRGNFSLYSPPLCLKKLPFGITQAD